MTHSFPTRRSSDRSRTPAHRGRTARGPRVRRHAASRRQHRICSPGRGHGRTDARVASVAAGRSEEHTSELQSLMPISYAVFCFKKNNHNEKPEMNYRQRKETMQHKLEARDT